MQKAISSLFMTGLPGPTVDDSSRDLVAQLGINHFIIFKRNVVDPDQLKKLCQDLGQLCREHQLDPPLISIDQEGGTVARLGPPFRQFADAREYGEDEEAEERVAEFARLCAQDLRECGINLNFAPVLDVCPANQGCFMEQRALGSDPARVAQLGQIIIETMQAGGVAACAKHFPGLGEGVVDPHLLLPRVSKSAAEIRAFDLIPFKEAIKAGVAAIMTSHVIYQHLDPETLATMSAPILTTLLRQELGYEGVVVTDDLEMGAIENDLTVPEAACRALKAGADLLLICHDHAKVRASHARINQALADNELSREQIMAASQRIGRLSASLFSARGPQ